MKKITKLTIVLAFMLGGLATFAQPVFVVPATPGAGALNAAIATYGGTRIYQLQAGQYYQLDAIIENVGYHLQIIGEVPAPGMPPATLQSNNPAGPPFRIMFNAKGDLTLKNVYFVNAAFNNALGTEFIEVNAAGANITLDKIILNPVAINNGIVSKVDNVSISVTNSLIMNHGTILSPNDGHFVNSAGSRLANLLVENNTFVAMGTTMFHGGYNKYNHGTIKWNHNTWVMQKSQIDWSTWEDDYVFTNNLMYDFNTQPWSIAWTSPGVPVTTPKLGLIYAGPQVGEVLPTLRKQYVEYNNLNRNPGFYTMINDLNVIRDADSQPHLTYMDLIWDATHDMSNPVVAERSRETILFADKTNYPNWNFGNTFNTDPQFVDPKIYAHSDNFVKWTKPATLVHAMGKPAASVDPVTTWAKWQWYEATDVNNQPSAGNNSAWPPFNGVYTNPAMLTASLEGLPLGDLNWFPAQKAIWMNNKAAIDAHVAAGNTSRITMSLGVKDFDNLDKFGFSYYPNPIKNQLNLSATNTISDVTVYNLLGQEVLKKTINSTNSSIDTSNLSSGSYVIKVVIDKTVGTYKIVKE